MKKLKPLIRLAMTLLLLAAVFQVPPAQSTVCTNGGTKNVITGTYCSCPSGTRTPNDRYACVNGAWVYQYSFCGGPYCQGGTGGDGDGGCPYDPGTHICPADCSFCY
jgi:hypothetical protein